MGSYQQYREQLAKRAAAVNGNGTRAADATGQVFAMPQSPQHSFAISNGPLHLPPNFFTSAPASMIMNSSTSATGIPLPSSFYVNGGSTLGPSISKQSNIDTLLFVVSYKETVL